jgi:hypothetical protein
MFWKKEEKITKKVDKIITGLVIWTAIASMIWLSKTDKWKKVTENVKTAAKDSYDKWKSLFWKGLVAIINFFKKK